MYLRIASVFAISLLVLGLEFKYKPKSLFNYPQRFETFEDYFPFYMSEHSLPMTRFMHAIGNSLVFFTVAVYPYIGAAFSASLALGFLVAPTLFDLAVEMLGMKSSLFELLVLIGFFIAISNWMANPNSKRKGMRDLFVPRFPVILVLAFGFVFALFGHFAFEKNRPAALLYPTYSLLADYKMFYNIVSNWKL
jgi:hypothetical protein